MDVSAGALGLSAWLSGAGCTALKRLRVAYQADWTVGNLTRGNENAPTSFNRGVSGFWLLASGLYRYSSINSWSFALPGQSCS